MTVFIRALLRGTQRLLGGEQSTMIYGIRVSKNAVVFLGVPKIHTVWSKIEKRDTPKP